MDHPCLYFVNSAGAAASDPVRSSQRSLGEPRTVGGREVEPKARFAQPPALVRRRRVGPGVVEHDANVESRRHRGVDRVQEAPELLGRWRGKKRRPGSYITTYDFTGPRLLGWTCGSEPARTD